MLATYDLNLEFSKTLEKNRQKNFKSLQSMIQKLRRGGDQFSANQLELFRNKLLAIENPNFSRRCPDLPNDPVQAEIVWRRTKAEWNTEFQNETFCQIRRLLVKLEPIAIQARADRKLELLRQLGLIADQLVTSVDPYEPRKLLDENRDKWPANVVQAFTEFETWQSQYIATGSTLFAELDKKWATFAKSNLANQLKDPQLTLEEIRSKVSSYARLTNTKIEWLGFLNNQPLPSPGDEAEKLLADFDQTSADRRLRATAEYNQARVELIDKLSANPFRDVAEQPMIDQLLASLTSQSGHNLFGIWTLPSLDLLPESDRNATRGFVKTGQQIYQQLQKQHAAAHNDLRKKLTPLRNERLQQEDFAGTLLLDEHFYLREQPRLTTWVRTSDQPPGSNQRFDFGATNFGMALAYQDDKFLIGRSSDDRSARWFPASQVVFRWEQFSLSREQIVTSLGAWRQYERAFDHPPSEPWDGRESLVADDQVIVAFERNWVVAKFVDYCPFGIVVSLPTYDDAPRYAMIPPEWVRVARK
jgi:hypothetical protein